MQGNHAGRMKDLKRIGRALALVWRSAPGWTALSVVLLLVQSATTLAALYLVKLIVDAVAEQRAPLLGEVEGFGGVLAMIAVAGGVTVVGMASRALASLAAEAKAQHVTDHMLERLHEKSAAVDYGYYEDPRYYNTLHRAQQEAPQRPTRLLDNLTGVAQSLVTVVGILVLLATVHWLLTLVIVLAVLPALWVRVRHSRRLHRWTRERSPKERLANYLGWVVGSVFHAKELRVFGLSRVFLERFRKLRKEIRDERIALARARSVADAGSQILATVVVFGALTFIAHRTFHGALTLGDMVMYFGAIQRGQSMLQGLFSGLGRLYEDNLFLTYVDDFLELEPTVQAPDDPTPVPRPIRSGLACRGVDFRYPTSNGPVLEGVDLAVRPGEVVALVGSNGSGKSTLVKLLCRLYDPLAGSVTLDGVDLRDMDPQELRRRFSVVFQDFARFDLSARDNIWFGDISKPRATPAVEAAARAAGAERAIGKLSHGYETILGRRFEKGAELSIGEWQKIALARAFLSDAEVLIVDEPTSALDAAAEAEVFEALRSLVRNRATIVISHRLSTVRMADRIYFLQSGRVAEVGSHSELMGRNGGYAELFGVQAAMYQGDPEANRPRPPFSRPPSSAAPPSVGGRVERGGYADPHGGTP